MKRAFALALALILVSAQLGLMEKTAKAAPELPWASLTGIQVVMGDKIIFGSYQVEIQDIDAVTWTSAIIQVSGPQGTKKLTLKENEYGYYPNTENPVMRFNIVIWNSGGTPTLLVTIESPLVKVSRKVINKGGTATLTGNVKVKLVSIDNGSAKFSATTPTSTTPYTFTLKPGEGRGITYKISSDYSYENFVYVYLNKTTSTSATVDFYMPKVATTSIKIEHKSSSGGGTTPTPKPTTSCNCLIHEGLLYKGESLTVKYNNTNYGIKLVSVSSTKVGVEVWKAKEKLGEYLLSVGQSKTITGTPVKFTVTTAEPSYNRAKIQVYGPEDVQVSPPTREAEIKATIDALPKKLLIGDYLVVAINVQNSGRGDAYDINVAAPIPDGFELVSSTKSWNIKSLPAFSNMPALVYVLKPTRVGSYDIGKAVVTYYDDKSLLSGKEKSASSGALGGITVYGIPQLEVGALAYNGTWAKYVTASKGDSIKMKLSIKASGSDPEYEFVNNVTLHLNIGDSLDGPTEIKFGTLKAKDSKNIVADFTVLGENLTNVEGFLTYVDPIGNEHTLYLGNLLTINSIPPVIIEKEVKVWPTPDELPEYVNRTLASLGNESRPLAEELMNITKTYIPPKTNTWKVLAILFIVLTVVFGGAAFKYWNDSEKLRKALEKKKAKRPGGLPKKEEETVEGSSRPAEGGGL